MNSTNLLQHQLNKFGVVTVMDILMLDTESSEPVLFLDTLKITSLEQEGEQKEIRGGIGAPKLISYDFARTVTLEIQDALASMSSLQALWGGKALEGDIEYTAIFEAKVNGTEVTIPEGIKLKTLPDFDKVVVIDIVNKKQGTATGAEDQVLTVADVTDKANVKVFMPDAAVAEQDSGAAGIAVNSTDVPPTVRMIGKTFFIDQATGKQIPMQIEIPLLKISMGGGMTMEAEGDAAVFDFSAEALADPISKDFFRLKQLG